MSKYYKCDLCGTPYAPSNYKHMTAYIESGDKTFNENPSNVHIWDVCHDCKNKILDFMDSLKPKEVEKDDQRKCNKYFASSKSTPYIQSRF